MFTPATRSKPKREIDQITGGDKGWPRAYVSTLEGSLSPADGFSAMVNMDLVQVAHPRPRPPLIRYGGQPLGAVIGRGDFTKIVLGRPEYWEISMQAVNVSEIKRLTITGAPTGGTFTLTYDGQTTTAIAYNASAAAVQSALEALSTIGAGNVACSGTALPSSAITLTFQGALANIDVSSITSTSSLTGGTSPTVSVSDVAGGGLRGIIHIRKDGGSWSAPDTDTRYSPTAEVSFAQAAKRVYLANGSDNLSFFDIDTSTITPYTQISSPSGLSATPTGLTGSGTTLYYWVSAINGSGETIATAFSALTVNKPRNDWDGSSEYITLNWSPVTNATGYVVYVGEQSGSTHAYYLTVVYANSFKDTGEVGASPLRRPPLGNSTAAPKLTWLSSRNGELYGLGDVDNPSYLWKDSGPTSSGDFYAGYVAIDYGGQSVPVALRPFRDGKGNAVVTVLTQGPPEYAKMYHVSYNLTDIGNESIAVPEVYEANGQSGTISPMGVVEADNSLYYPTGEDFKSNGSAPNIPNILSTRSLSQWIEPDVRGLNLAAMNKCVGVAYRNRIYWVVPYISSENNEIWIRDISRNGAWILRWKVAAKYIWSYQDNSGDSHLCVLVNNKILEFDWSYGTPGQDDGESFSTLLSGRDAQYGRTTMGIATIYKKRFEILNPKGSVTIKVSGESKSGTVNIPATTIFSMTTPETGWGKFVFGQNEFGEDPGPSEGQTQRKKVIPIRVRKNINELLWEIRTEKSGCDYTLAETHTEGIVIDKAYLGG